VFTTARHRASRVRVLPLGDEQLARAKPSFATRRVPRSAMRTLVCGSVRPRAGDLVYARISRLGQHRRIERPDGRRAQLHVGDAIVVAYGDRYAPDQYEAQVPADLGPAQLVASGGIASTVLSRSMEVRAATDVVPVGLVGDERGRPLNLRQFALPPVPTPVEAPRTVAVIGTSMNSGKTTTVHYLVHGFDRAGMRPGAMKVTGTGSGNDYWVMLDAGAHQMLDFTDAGLASTYRQPMPVIERTFGLLLDHLTASGSGINLVEVADGIYQRETSRLIESAIFQERVDVVVFAAGDAMGAAAGVSHLRGLDLDVAAVSGRITRSPLATREAVDATHLPVLTISELADPTTMAPLLHVDTASIRRTDPAPWPAAGDPEPVHGPTDLNLVVSQSLPPEPPDGTDVLVWEAK
jgi:hypothetical protein